MENNLADFDDDDDLLDESHQGSPLPCLTIVDSQKANSLLKNIQLSHSHFIFHKVSYTPSNEDLEKSFHIALVECRMTSAFEDIGTIRKIRGMKPGTPILALSTNMDDAFVTEIYKAGATDVIASDMDSEVLAQKIIIFNNISDSQRLLEVQNKELIKNQKEQRIAHEKKLVAEKERSVALVQAQANKQMKEILDHLGEAFFTVDPTLKVGDGVSQACKTIFQNEISGKPLGDILNLEKGKEGYLISGLEQLFEDIMPMDLNVSLLPKKCKSKENRYLEFKYTPIVEDKAPVKLIIIASDVTEIELERKRLNEHVALNLSIINILKEKDAFITFLKDFKSEIHSMQATTDVKILKRILHTIKGNSACYGLEGISSCAHKGETNIEQSDDHIKETEIIAIELESQMRNFLENNSSILKIDYDDQFESGDHIVNDATLDKIDQSLKNVAKSVQNEVRDIIRNIKAKPISILSANYESRVEKLARKGNKKINFSITGQNRKIDFEHLKPLLNNLVHAISNSCDHGLETPEERTRKGKDESGKLHLDFDRLTNQYYKISISDDGRGIDRDTILKKAIEKNIISEEEAPLLNKNKILNLIFEDGFSTADQVTESSGRGVGMAALRHEIEQLGGSFRVNTEVDKGTHIEILIPPTHDFTQQNKPKVLLAKNKENLIPYKQYFYERKFDVDIVDNGLDALFEISKESHNLVILDIDIPIISGIAVVKRMLKNVPGKSSVHIIFTCSGEDIRKYQKDFLAYKNIEFWHAPIKPSDFSSIIQKLGNDWSKEKLNNILLIDDNEIDVKIIKKTLIKHNYNVKCTTDSVKAVDFLSHSKKKPNLILMDLNMPKLDGFHALRKIKALENSSNKIPVIAISGSKVNQDETISMGFSDFIVKPINAHDLMIKVELAIKNSEND